jgi:hypothetical protein
MTSLIGWWGIGAIRSSVRNGHWSVEARTCGALVAALLASGALSFNYSRDRLGGMAAVFYALAAFFALRAAGARMVELPRIRFVAACMAIAMLAAAWNIRAVATVEAVRRLSIGNRQQWAVQLPDRRLEFADRPIYLQIMESMIEQGTDPGAPAPTRYPRWIESMIQ